MLLAVGNHDASSGCLEGDGLELSSDPIRLGPFLCVHHPQEIEGGYVLSGHLHPSVKLEGKARLELRLPCFWFGSGCGVLPAFGRLTGNSVVRTCRGDQVLVLAEGRVMRVS